MLPILLVISLLQAQVGVTFGNRLQADTDNHFSAAAGQLTDIVSNQPDRIRSNKRFTLLMVYDPQASDHATQWLAGALQSPQSPELNRWMTQCDVRGVSIDSPHAEKLRWHIQKHQTLPILLLQESPGSGTGEGATWWSCSGRDIPLDEASLVTELQRWYAATIQARETSGMRNAMTTPVPTYPDNYVIPRRSINSSGNSFADRRPLLNPKIDIDVPDTINTKVEASLRPDTLRGLVIGGFVLLIAALSIAYAMIHSARIIGEAITDEPDQLSPTEATTHGS